MSGGRETQANRANCVSEEGVSSKHQACRLACAVANYAVLTAALLRCCAPRGLCVAELKVIVVGNGQVRSGDEFRAHSPWCLLSVFGVCRSARRA